MAKIIGVKFQNTSKIYYFDPKDEVYEKDTGVIVETSKGIEYATVAFGTREVPENEVSHPLKPVIRKATASDEQTVKKNIERVPDAIKKAEEKIKKLGLDMKLVGCEFAFDGKKVTFFFTSDGRVDFRELVKELASTFKIRIELRQIGIRDETKYLGGIAPCGRECCCSCCVPDFKKVSIKMAKTQGLSLNPTKISGLCGRLMCCLEYENGHYSEVYGKMPKIGSIVGTPEGNGTVIGNNMLKLISKVKIVKPDGSEVYKDFNVSELKISKHSGEGEERDEVSSDLKKILD